MPMTYYLISDLHIGGDGELAAANSRTSSSSGAGDQHGLAPTAAITPWSATASTQPQGCRGQAAPGEVLVTEDVYKAISAAFPGAMRAEYSLKGISPPTGWCGIKNYKWNELNFCVRTLARTSFSHRFDYALNKALQAYAMAR